MKFWSLAVRYVNCSWR